MKRNLMRRAHQIAKGLEGDYRARMSMALRQAWKEEKGLGNTETVIWTTPTGNVIEFVITVEHEVGRKTVNLDGDIVDLGQETRDGFEIATLKNGKHVARTHQEPTVITKTLFPKSFHELTAKGLYAKLGDNYISKEQYDLITAAIERINKACKLSEEYKVVKAAEIAKERAANKALAQEAARYAEQTKNGLCHKCGTYCFGDCEAN